MHPLKHLRAVVLFLAFCATGAAQGPSCSYTLSPATMNLPSSGGAGSIAVNTSPGCPWAITAQPAWLFFQSSGAGMGPAVLSFTAQPSFHPVPRAGVVDIAGQTVIIHQAGNAPTCTTTLSSGNALVDNNGGSGSFQVSSNCPWAALSSAFWVTLSNGATGTGNGTVNYTVQPLSLGHASRAATISVNGLLFRIAQNASTCTFSVPTDIQAPAAGLSIASLNVTPSSASCAWSASGNADWIRLLSGTNGSVSGLVSYSVRPNAGAERTGTLTIAGRTVTVRQASGLSCPATLAPAAATFAAAGSSGATVSVQSPCPWTATSTANWIRITSASNGNGPGAVTYRVDPNTSASPRTGSLLIAGQTFTVTQDPPAPCRIAVGTASATVAAAGGTVTIPIAASASCGWAIGAVPSWIAVVQGVGTGNGTMHLNIAANTGTASREAALALADRIITITQPAAAAFSCEARPSLYIPTVRSEGMAEMTADVILECQGTAAQAIRGDILVQLNTRVTSRLVNASGTIEALLLVNDPGVPQPGSNAFAGTLMSNDTVRFPNVPIANAGMNYGRRFRVVNIRADGTVPNLGAEITAAIQITNVGVTNARQLVGRRTAGVTASLDTASAITNGVTVPVTFRRLAADAFRPRLDPGPEVSHPGYPHTSESGYVYPPVLGQRVGLAETGTRLMVRLRNLPSGARVFAPLQPPAAQDAARLVTSEPSGTGVGFLSGTTPQEMPVTNGEAVITWEVTANTTPDSLTFPVTITGVTLSAANAIAAVSAAFLGPIAVPGAPESQQPVPRFLTPGTQRRPYRLRIAGSLSDGALSAAVRSPAGFRRAPTGNRSFGVGISVTNDSEVPTPETYIRGNLSAGVAVSADCNAADSRATCQGGDGSAVVTVPSLDPGQTITLHLPALLSDDAPGGSLVRLQATASADFTVAADAGETCLTGFSEPMLQTAGGVTSGTLRIYACGPWSLDLSSAPWLTLSATRGTGDATITYTIAANPFPTARSVTLALTRTASITVVQDGGQGNTAHSLSGLRFVPVTPCRLLETRARYAGSTWTGIYGPPLLAAGQTRLLPIAGAARCGIPAAAKAFILNVTADTVDAGTGPVDAITVYPAGRARPNFFTLRTSTGGYIANSAIVEAGVNGAIEIYTSNAVNLMIDISGYFTDGPAASGLLYYPFGPCRAVDTRNVYNTLPAPYGHQRFQARETRALRLPGSPNCQGLPAAAAYSVQMTLTSGGPPVSYITAWSAGQPQPVVSNMNSPFGYTVANSAIIPARADGAISLYTSDSTDVILDVNGYFAPDDGSGRGLSYFPVPQCRVLNTQNSSFTGNFGPPALTPSGSRVVSLADGGCANLPRNARAFALNAWVAPGGAPMPFLSMWPVGTEWPGISQLNAFEGQTVANSAIVPSGPNGQINLLVNGSTHAGLEAAGYFGR